MSDLTAPAAGDTGGVPTALLPAGLEPAPAYVAAILYCLAGWACLLLTLQAHLRYGARLALRSPHWFMLLVPSAAWLLAGGMGCRVALIAEPSRGLYAAMQCLLLIPPALLPAANHVALGRLMALCDPLQLGPLDPAWVARGLLAGDVACVALQAAGAGLLAGADLDQQREGEVVMLAGLSLQLALLLLLAGLGVWVLTSPRLALRWRAYPRPQVHVCLLATTGLLGIRTVYRIVEFARGYAESPTTQEAYFYGLDFVPLFLCVVVFCVCHPGLFLPPGPPIPYTWAQHGGLKPGYALPGPPPEEVAARSRAAAAYAYALARSPLAFGETPPGAPYLPEHMHIAWPPYAMGLVAGGQGGGKGAPSAAHALAAPTTEPGPGGPDGSGPGAPGAGKGAAGEAGFTELAVAIALRCGPRLARATANPTAYAPAVAAVPRAVLSTPTGLQDQGQWLYLFPAGVVGAWNPPPPPPPLPGLKLAARAGREGQEGQEGLDGLEGQEGQEGQGAVDEKPRMTKAEVAAWALARRPRRYRRPKRSAVLPEPEPAEPPSTEPSASAKEEEEEGAPPEEPAADADEEESGPEAAEPPADDAATPASADEGQKEEDAPAPHPTDADLGPEAPEDGAEVSYYDREPGPPEPPRPRPWTPALAACWR